MLTNEVAGSDRLKWTVALFAAVGGTVDKGLITGKRKRQTLKGLASMESWIRVSFHLAYVASRH